MWTNPARSFISVGHHVAVAEEVGTPQEAEERRILPGRAEHDLVQELGSTVYETAVTEGWIDAGDPEYAKGTARRSAVDLLTEIGLLQLDPQAKRFIPVDPSAASDLLVVPLAQQGAELLAESARWNETFSQLGQVFRGSMVSHSRAITEVQGFEAINRFIDSQLNDCRTEFLAAQPYGRRPATTLAEAEPRDVRALRRGVSLRTLYQHSARQSIATREYVAEVTALGAEIRTSDEFFKRLLMFDRHTALIPATENRAVAVAIHEKSIVAFLLDLYERAWERAMPFTVEDRNTSKSVAAEVRAMTLRLLVEGHSDAASAKRMGVSVRTYAAYIAALKEEFGVETRFQLGWAMSRTSGIDLDTPAAAAVTRSA